MIDTYLQHKDSIGKVLLTTKVKDVGALFLTDDENMAVKELKDFLQIFAAATKALQSSSVPTSNLIALTYFVIKGDLEEGRDNPDIINKAPYEIALDNIDYRLRPTKFQLCAALLDPTSCNVRLLRSEIHNHFQLTPTALLKHYLIKYKFDQLVDEEASQPNAERDQSAQSSSESSYKISMLNKLGGNQGINTAANVVTMHDEITNYFEESKKCDAEANILEWWKKHEGTFGRLAKLAKLTLGCPATSAVSESAFSVAGCVVTAKRSKISPFKVSDVLFIKDNYKLLQSYWSN